MGCMLMLPYVRLFLGMIRLIHTTHPPISKNQGRGILGNLERKWGNYGMKLRTPEQKNFGYSKINSGKPQEFFLDAAEKLCHNAICSN